MSSGTYAMQGDVWEERRVYFRRSHELQCVSQWRVMLKSKAHTWVGQTIGEVVSVQARKHTHLVCDWRR